MDLVDRPYFINPTGAENIIEGAVECAMKNFPVKRKDCHVILLGPELIKDPNNMFPQNYSIGARIIAEMSFGDKAHWEYPFDEIAQCKSLQLWQGRNGGGNMIRTPAHLLFEGDTPFCGGDSMEGLVAACSGFQEYFDCMVARMVLAQVIAMTQHAYEEFPGIQNRKAFLGT